MRYAIYAAICCLCGLVAVAAGAPEKQADRLVFRNAGFSIAPLDERGKDAQQVLQMFLPASGGFAPNVSVMIQPYQGTLEQYADVSKKQFEAMKLKVLAENAGKDTLTLEYTGKMANRSLHWYVKAVLKTGAVYLATATATEDQWKDSSAKLKRCVDSLETMAAAAPAQGGD